VDRPGGSTVAFGTETERVSTVPSRIPYSLYNYTGGQ